MGIRPLGCPFFPPEGSSQEDSSQPSVVFSGFPSITKFGGRERKLMSLEETLNDTPTTSTDNPGVAEQHPTGHNPEDSTPTVHAEAASAATPAEKEPSMDDFAAALDQYEQEQAQTEAA